MTVMPRALRFVRPVLETLLAGVLVGVVVAAFAAQASGSGSTTSAGAEVPVARSYMLALIRNDTDTMVKLSPGGDVLSQAIAFQKLAAASSTVKFETLTFLGKGALGGLGVHLYVVEYEGSDGTHLTPFAVAVYRGNVVGFRGLSGPVAAQ